MVGPGPSPPGRVSGSSTAPMSDPSAAFAIALKSNGRGRPRWSVVSPKAEPASITGLPSAGAIVWVGPPLSWSGPSSGSAVSGEPTI